MQSWWHCGVRFGDPKFDSTKYILVNLPSIIRFSFRLYCYHVQIILSRLVFLLIGKVVVLSTRITFKRINSAITKTDSLALKILWSGVYLCYRESLLILFSPTSLSTLVTLTVTGVGTAPSILTAVWEGAGEQQKSRI